MVGGQAIDLQAGGQAPRHAIALRRRRAARDARAQNRRADSRVGGLRRADGRADEAAIAAIDAYGSAVGLAFQIVDDILDVEGDPASLGKTAGKDAASAKPTYPALFGLDRSRTLAAESLQRAHAALEGAGITNSFLGGIADWVVARKS
jgi:hypothetical protein